MGNNALPGPTASRIGIRYDIRGNKRLDTRRHRGSFPFDRPLPAMSSSLNLSAAHEKFQRRARAIFHPLLQRRTEIQKPSPLDGHYPQEVWSALVAAGYFDCFRPAPAKGAPAGLGIVGACLLLEELAAADAANLLPILTAMGLRCLATAASGELRDRTFPQLVKGHLPLLFAASERRSGYNVLRMTSFATRKGSGYVLNGEKAYVAGADLSPWAAVAARTTDQDAGRRQGLDKTHGLSLFLVRLDSPGLAREAAPQEYAGVLRRYRLHFDNVFIPAPQRIGPEGEAAAILLDAFNVERLLTAAVRIGISRFCIDYGHRHGRERSVFGSNKPIASYQTIQHPLEEARMRLDAARLLLLRAAWGMDNGASPAEIGLYANAIKVVTVEVATSSVEAAMEAVGERAYDEQVGLARLRDAVKVGKSPPMGDVMAMSFVSEHALGLPRAY